MAYKNRDSEQSKYVNYPESCKFFKFLTCLTSVCSVFCKFSDIFT